MSDYTLEDVRKHYAFRMAGDRIHRTDDYYADFDRALAAHDAAVAAKALRDAAAEMQDIFLVQRSLLNGTTYEWLRDRADRIEEERG